MELQSCPGSMAYNYQNMNWLNAYYPVSQPKGFKLQFREDISQITPVVVNGFKADPATTPVELKQQYASGGTTVDFENWIGYFVPHTLGAGTAFSRALPVNSQERNWAISTASKPRHGVPSGVDGHLGGAWIRIPTSTPCLKVTWWPSSCAGCS